MNGWPDRVRGDLDASAPEPPELPRRQRILGHAVWLKDRPGIPDGLARCRPRSYAEAVEEAGLLNDTLIVGRAAVVEFREVAR